MNTLNKDLKVSADFITQHCPTLTAIQLNQNVFSKVTPPTSADSTSLVFANSDELIQAALKNNALGLIIPDKLLPLIQGAYDKSKSLWTTTNIHHSMSEVLKHFDTKSNINSSIHPTAFIDPTATVNDGTVIEPYAVIGKNVVIGTNCTIGAHCVIENNARIGSYTKLASHVSVGFGCQIGNNCIIGPHTCFGSDGFGFYTDKLGAHHKIPQIGIVVIEDNCEFGAYCAVDRAALTETRIRKGSKFDNLIHVAHNCDIGENALITAGFIVAGSTKIGRNLTTAGGVHIVGHVNIADNVILTGRTGVTSSLDKSGIYGGFPAVDHKESLKILMSQSALPKLRKQMAKVLKHLGLNEDYK